ncbi:MAG: hypothetical protein M3Q44_03330 [bacterium]|nr:hypothetical protein [bacterium]
MADLHNDDVVVDLGSGDGSIIIKIAEDGFVCHGYEINLFLVIYTWIRIYKRGLQRQAFVHWGNMWKVDCSKFTVVIIYGFPTIMKDLEKKLQTELQVNARVISNSFQFPVWKNSQALDEIFLYKKSSVLK